MLKAVTGHSEDVDSLDAVHEILDQCQKELNGLIPQAGILYSAIGYDYKILLEEIVKAFPDIELIGCSTDGEISSRLGFTEDTIVLILFYSDNIEIRAGIGCRMSESPIQCSTDAVQMAQSKLNGDPSFCLTLPDGLDVKKDRALRELQIRLGNSVPIYGGFAAEQANWKETFQFYRTEIHKNSMPILVFGGNILFSHGLASGWQPIGKKGKITKVRGSYVYEIDHQPALDFYRHYLGPLAMQSREFPFAVFEKNQEFYYVRVVIGLDEEKKCLTFSGEMPEHAFIQITETTRDQMLEGARESVKKASEAFPGKIPEAALIFSCAARKEILGTKTQEEYQSVQAYAKGNFPVIGFYSYGEICPTMPPAPTRLHGGTIVTLFIGSL
ncbi:MAG: hypothetical protein GY795_33850 [Desulfobacterales bacterium]|nr:hypothetical protein [Desulfobacterales bacterium]